MCFKDAMRPLSILSGLYLLKVFFLLTENTFIKIGMAISVIVSIYLGDTLFDSDPHNNVPLWLLAIPISIFLFG
jgi:hypothetical protein